MKCIQLQGKRTAAIFLVLVMSVTFFSGLFNEKAEAAATQEKKKLVIAQHTSSFVIDYDDNYLTNLIEEELNVELEFYLLPSDGGELSAKISLMAAAKDSMPDIVNFNNALSREAILNYGSKGIFIPLNDYLDDATKTPNFAAIPEEDRKIMKEAGTSADGNIYVMTKFEPETWNLTPHRMFINGAWLKELGLEFPETTDELYDVLIAFRDKDPNENGVQDELGVYGFFNGGYGENIITSIMNSFVYARGTDLALDETGTEIIAPYTTDGWKEGLAFMNKLYNEKLLAASIFTDDQTQFRATLNNEVNIVGFTSAGSTSNWPDANNNANFQEMDIIKPLEGPSGIAYTPYTEYTPLPGFSVTSNCKDPDLAVKLGDLFYSEKYTIITRYGEEDVDWTKDPELLKQTSNAYVDAGLYDSLYIAQVQDIWANPSNKHWYNIAPRYAPMNIIGNRTGNLTVPYDPTLKTTMLAAFNYEHYYPAHPEHILGTLSFTLEEADENAGIVTDVNEYVRQSMAEFITGARDIEREWESYLKELDNMDLSILIKNNQAAFERLK